MKWMYKKSSNKHTVWSNTGHYYIVSIIGYFVIEKKRDVVDIIWAVLNNSCQEALKYSNTLCFCFLFPDISDISETCQPISEEQCAQILPYNQTLAVLSSGTIQKPPWGVVAPIASCSEKAKRMFCAEVYSESGCSPQERLPYIVCTSLCEQVWEECRYFFTALRIPLNCQSDQYREASSDFLCVWFKKRSNT